jgi:hypothetical protein
VTQADVYAVSDDEEGGLRDEERDEEGRGSARLVTRRLSLRTQLRASYSIYTKGDIAKDNTRTIGIRREAEQPSGIGSAVGTVTQMRMTISCKTIARADMLWRSLLSQVGWRAGR